MSVFGSIMSKIFGHAAAPAAQSAGTPAAPSAVVTPAAEAPDAAVLASAAVSAVPGAAPAAAAQSVDVEAVLTDMAAHSSQSLDWRHSIVDLMKLLGLDSSLGQREALAKELGYTGMSDGSAAMNIWLHKQVMHELAENGGRVPADLRA